MFREAAHTTSDNGRVRDAALPMRQAPPKLGNRRKDDPSDPPQGERGKKNDHPAQANPRESILERLSSCKQLGHHLRPYYIKLCQMPPSGSAANPPR